jgi:hypothetical protein
MPHSKTIPLAACLVVLLMAACSSDSPETNVTGPVLQPGVSDDPAIRNTDLDLEVKLGMFYENIKTEPLSQTHETITQVGEPLNPLLWGSASRVEYNFLESRGRIKMNAAARILANTLNALQPPIGFKEIVVGKATLMREFTVEETENPGTALAGSVIRFDTAWLGRLWSTGLRAETGYEIRFIMRDLTEGRVKIDHKLASNSITGEIRKIAVKGIPIPVVVPGWSKDQTEDERHAFPIPLITGHTYRIQVSLELTATSGMLGTVWTSFDRRTYDTNLGGYSETGFLDFKNIDLDIGN